MPPKKTTALPKAQTAAKKEIRPKATKATNPKMVQKPLKKSNSSTKGNIKGTSSKAKKNNELSNEMLAATRIQSIGRVYLARKQLAKLQKEKKDYDAMIEKLQKEAWLAIVQRERDEDERQRQKEEEERKRKAQERKWIKSFLEASFDGELEEMKKILFEMEKQLKNNSSLSDDGLRRYINKSKQKMIECADANGNSALSEASAGGDVATITFLIENGANINTVGSFGRTPLYRASFGGHIETVKLLLKEGGDPRLVDHDGVNAEQVSALPEIAIYLQEWDIEETERNLEKISERQEQLRIEEAEHNKKETKKIENDISALENEYSIKQKLLRKAYEELNKRIAEHDNAVAQGFDRPDVTLQAIHDAEVNLAHAQREEEEVRKKVYERKLYLREQKSQDTTEDVRVKKCHIKELEQVLMRDVGDVIKNCGKHPLIIDSSNLAVTFLRYRDTNYINMLNPKETTEDVLRKALLGAIRYGKLFVVDMMEVDMMGYFEDMCNSIERNLFQLLITKELTIGMKYLCLVRPDDGKEYDKQNFSEERIAKFQLVIVTKIFQPPDHWLDKYYPLKIITTSID